MSASLAPECNEVKEKYDNCFIKWYSEKYLRGTADTDECAELFKTYNKCLFNALKARGIDSMVEEARKEAQETDAEHMTRPARCLCPLLPRSQIGADKLTESLRYLVK